LFDPACVTNRQLHSAGSTVQATLGPLDHCGIQIEGRDPSCVKSIKQYLDADAATAADFENVLAAQSATSQPLEPSGLAVVLMRGPHRIVHGNAFDPVELHPDLLFFRNGQVPPWGTFLLVPHPRVNYPRGV